MTTAQYRARPDRAASPRVAALVYNDCHADARVLKTCESLQAAGADVTIYAVARTASGYPAGTTVLGNGVRLIRVQEPGFLRMLAAALDRLHGVMRKVRGLRSRGRRRPPVPGPVCSSLADAGTPGAAESARGSLDRFVGRLAFELVARGIRPAVLADYWARVVRAASAEQFDVIHANDGNTLVPAWILKRRTGGALVYDAHELWLRRNVARRLVAPLVEAMIERAVIGRADAVVTVSNSIAGWLQDRYRLREHPTLVRNIPEQREGDRSEGRLHALAGLDQDQRIVAYSGRITTARGLEETIDALALLPETVHLVLLGYGERSYVARLQAAAAERQLTDRVHLVGQVPHNRVAQTLADADVAVVYVRPVCLSYRFSLPNKLFESIHASVPVAAANLPDMSEIVEAHGVGVVFEAENPQDMARKIEAVLSDPEPYRRAARAAAEALTWENEAKRLITLYRRVLGTGGDGLRM